MAVPYKIISVLKSSTNCTTQLVQHGKKLCIYKTYKQVDEDKLIYYLSLCNLLSNSFHLLPSAFVNVNDNNVTMLRNCYDSNVFSFDFDKNTIIQFIQDLSLSIYYMYKSNFIHGNIIPSNIVYTNENRFYLVDTGNYLLNNEMTFDDIFISQFYSPEYLSNKELSIESDIWGFGCILASIVSGDSPINILNEYKCNIYFDYLDDVKELLFDIITNCLNFDQYKRITPYELILYSEKLQRIDKHESFYRCYEKYSNSYENEVNLLIFNDSYIRIPSLLDRITSADRHLIKKLCNFYNFKRNSKVFGFLINMSICDYPDTHKVVSKLLELKEKGSCSKILLSRGSDYLLNCCYTPLLKNEIKLLSVVIRSCISLEKLYLGNMKLDDKDIDELAPAFQQIKNLKVLSFSTNNITDKGIDSLSKYVIFSSSFQCLFLDNNNIAGNTEGFKVFMNLLCQSESLERISLQDNKLEKNGANVINDIIKNFTSLVELNLQNNNIKLEDMKLITKSLDRNKNFYFFGVSKNDFSLPSFDVFRKSYLPFVQLK